MARRSFLGSLARGFVRAAVNQVGRDGGRVISNRVYNGQNYVPVSNAPQQPFMGQPAPQGSSGHPVSEPVSTTRPFSGGKIALLSLLSLIVMLFGGIGVFIYGLATYSKKTDKLEWHERVAQYAPDRRYKTGEKFVGYAMVKREMTVTASPEAVAIHQRNGRIAMLIGAAGIILFVVTYLTSN